ncbi:MAG: hypothetical protein Q4D51_13040 [Eubacteriales bacterium]|nr:hypothetical protein [Eubacteriales bacterium]
MRRKMMVPIFVAALCLSGCAAETDSNENKSVTVITTTEDTSMEATSEDSEMYSCDEGDAHAIDVDGKEETYQSISVEKTGDSEGDEADFYGSNAAVFAQNGAALTISNAQIKTNGKHANAVFSYGEGTVVNISDSQIDTEQSNSGGIMVTGGGTLNATNLTVTTQSGSSAPIRSDRGGGQISVNGGTYKSYGSGSPAIYSTADINVENATLYSDVAEAVVVEGKNSVTIANADVTGKNTTHNSDKADVYRNVMIYQSMSGDSEEGKGVFTMTGGSLTSENGGMFFVTNTIADINLENVTMNYATDDFLRIEKAGWGNDGSNGGQVTLNAKNQNLDGIITVDEISVLNMYLKENASFNGCIESSGKVYVELDADSTWTLTGDSEVTALTCDSDAINLNGYKLKVNGKVYEEGTACSGEAIEIIAPASSGMGQMPPGDGNGQPPENPEGMEPPEGGKQPPEKPEGMKEGEQPPEKPDGNEIGAPPEKPE